jgi:hypothetical protein
MDVIVPSRQTEIGIREIGSLYKAPEVLPEADLATRESSCRLQS